MLPRPVFGRRVNDKRAGVGGTEKTVRERDDGHHKQRRPYAETERDTCTETDGQ